MTKTHAFSTTAIAIVAAACSANGAVPMLPSAVEIPLAGNAYVTSIGSAAQHRARSRTTPKLDSDKDVISAWFRTETTGSIRLYLKYHTEANSTISITYAGTTFAANLQPNDSTIFVGTITLSDTGYHRFDMQCTANSGAAYPHLSALLVDGIPAERMNYVHDFSYYWGRRGPSVHLNYTMHESDTIEYFYSEVLVPRGSDPVGSYFMANGFGEGYFGMQVNSESERRILFSVWSPFQTDRPQDIPEDQRILLLSKGAGVHTGEFGNEGSGGQSYLQYAWQSGASYGFLTRVRPNGNGSTEYSAWFYAPERSEWMLIARFLRPQTTTYYRRAHSFLESFIPDNGWLQRRAYYHNQWFRTTDGRWLGAAAARFTCDDTGRRRVRLDYKGGAEGNKFYLQNCGFFNDYTPYGTTFQRTTTNSRPTINIDALP